MKGNLKAAYVAALIAAVAAVMAVNVAAAPADSKRATACGGVVNLPPNDPEKLLPGLKLSKAVQHDYTGWPFPIAKSAWANWKPSHKPPYNVAVVWSQPANGFNDDTFRYTQSLLKKSKIIGNVTASQASSPTAIADQLQAYNAAVQSKPDLIIFAPLSPTAATASIDAAGKQGIPTVVLYNYVDTPYGVVLAANPYLDGAETGSRLVKALGGEGNILQVLGTPTALTTVQEQLAWNKVFADCPGIKTVGQVFGFFSTALAQTAVSGWLATHPEKIDGVIETASMGPGIFQAFQQAGRPIPVIGMTQAAKGVMAHWRDNKDKGYKAAALYAGANEFSSLITSVATRMLAGQGPKVSFIPLRFVGFTENEMAKLVPKQWTTSTPGAVELPYKRWWTKADLDKMFTNPKVTTGVNR